MERLEGFKSFEQHRDCVKTLMERLQTLRNTVKYCNSPFGRPSTASTSIRMSSYIPYPKIDPLNCNGIFLTGCQDSKVSFEPDPLNDPFATFEIDLNRTCFHTTLPSERF
jgi:hypothetical protein